MYMWTNSNKSRVVEGGGVDPYVVGPNVGRGGQNMGGMVGSMYGVFHVGMWVSIWPLMAKQAEVTWGCNPTPRWTSRIIEKLTQLKWLPSRNFVGWWKNPISNHWWLHVFEETIETDHVLLTSLPTDFCFEHNAFRALW